MHSRPKRIMIIGQPGSGKSTLAVQLGEVTNLPVYHIDKEVHWLPNWVERDRAEKSRLCAEIHSRDEWIFEGGHSTAWDERLARADMLIWLDVPLWLRYYRVIKRSLVYWGRSRPDLPDECPERIDWEFIHFIWRTRKTLSDRMRQIFDKARDDKRAYNLTSTNQIDNFVTQMKINDINRQAMD